LKEGLKRPKIFLGAVVTLALVLSMFVTALPVYAADVVTTKGVTPTTPNVYRLGDTIHYTMSIINVSNVTGANENVVVVEVRDVLPNGTTVYPADPALPYTLAPGHSQSYSYDWVATRTGTVINTFYARGYQISTGGNDNFEHQVQKSSLVIDPRIDIEKYIKDNTATWQDADSATGPYIPSQTWVVFRFTIHNTGDVALTSVNLTDTDISNFYTDEACTNPASFPTNLAVDETKTYYSRLAWAGGQHSDTATVTGAPPLGTPVSDSDPAYYFGSSASIDVVKYVWDGATWDDADTAPGPTIASVQNPVVFRFVITNNDNVDLTNVTLTDTDMSTFYNDQACTSPASFPTTLAIGQTKTYYGKLAWAQGQHADTATATGTPPVGGPVSDSDPAHYLGSSPSIDVEKYVWNGATWDDADAAPGASLIAAHNPVVFRFVITNNSGVNLTAVNLTDTHMSAFYTDQNCTTPAVFPITTLTPTGPPVTVYGNLTWAQGQHTNNATATGTPPVGPPVSDTDPANYFGPPPSIDVEKYVWNGATWDDADAAPGASLIAAHNPVVFRFVITNNSGVNLTAVNLTDTHMSAFYTDQNCTTPAVFPITTLTPTGPPVTVYGNLTWAEGQHTNNATATGTPPVGPPVSDTDPANYFGLSPGIDLIKYVSVNNQTSWDDANSAPGPSILVGKDVYFKFRIQNTGNVTLTGINLTDTVYNLAGITPALPPSLAAGAVYEGIIGPIAAAAGSHTNTGNATGYWDGNPVSDTDPANYFGSPPPPAIDIEKYTNGQDADYAPGVYISINSTVTWTYIITNTGGVNLINIVVRDDNGTPGNPGDDWNPTLISGDDGDNILQTTETWVYQAIGTATAGYYANIGYVSGTPLGGDPVVSESDPSHYYTQLPVGWESYPVNKVRVLLPWIGLLGAIIAGASLLVLRRRRLG
jgi:uncharacterized repeat protein (TIGR01451 family)